MTIINPLPYTIANGDPVDATPVQANLNQIVSNVNANAAALAGDASQEFLVATTTNPAGAVPLAQAQSQFAPISGSAVYAPASGNASQGFSVGASTSGSVQAPQTTQIIGQNSSNSTNVTASRTIGTLYTNSTGRVLYVEVMLFMVVTAGPGECYIQVTVNSAVKLRNYASWVSTNISVFPSAAFLVPPGGTYTISISLVDGNNSSYGVQSWYEY